MDRRDSPYVPGAGTRPYALVGREDIVEDFTAVLDRLEHGRAATAPVITGTLGTGKTVLRNEMVRIARERGWFTAVEEVTLESNLPGLVARMARDVLFEMSARKRFGDRVQRALGVLKAFTSVKVFGIGISIDADAVHGKADTGDLSRDLRDLFVEIGTLARDHDAGVLFALDETHVLAERELDALHFALHQTAQDGLPIAFVPSGLFPSWQNGAETHGEPRLSPSSYTARMYTPFYRRLLPLEDEAACRVFAEPALHEGVDWDDEALSSAIEFCEGNPWLMHVLADAAWKIAQAPTITYDDVVRAEQQTQERLNEWFMPRLLRDLGTHERRVLDAMAKHGSVPVPYTALFGAFGIQPRAALPEIAVDSSREVEDFFAQPLSEAEKRAFVRRAEQEQELVTVSAQLARRDLVTIDYRRGSSVHIESDSLDFNVPRLAFYLRGSA